jgi:1-acyl-sn-glycerol-3-phosphate acyltransferase
LPLDSPTSKQRERAGRRVLAEVRDLADEIRVAPGRTRELDLDSSLDRDAGLDSVARMELLARLERAFGVRLDEQRLAATETPRAVLSLVLDRSVGSPSQPPERREGSPKTAASRSSATKAAATASATAETLLQILERQAAADPSHVSVRLVDDGGDATPIRARELLDRAAAVAAMLQRRGLEPGGTVALALPTDRTFLDVLFGVWYAGGVPVPLPPPQRISQLEDHLLRQAGILRRSKASILIADEATRRLSAILRAQVGGLRAVIAPGALSGSAPSTTAVERRGDDLALLQFTSGSTGDPKGVMLTHANLLANVRAIGKALGIGPGDAWLSWLPLHHDMGLIGGVVNAIYHGIPLVLLTPLAFLARPERWLWAAHRHGGTITVAPNFAYELCARRPGDDVLEGLDLSGLRLALNGAEPVSPDTIARFTGRFAPYGFRPEALLPVYGLAENTLAVTFPEIDRAPRLDAIDRRTLQVEGRAVPAKHGDDRGAVYASCGTALEGVELRVADARGEDVGERSVGHVQFRGTSATRGYYRDDEATRRLLETGWIDSGDLGYLADGELYLTGRSKDMIIRAGRNIAPHSLEEAIGDLAGVRTGCVAVFGSTDRRLGTERLIVAAETRETDPETRERMRAEIDRVCSDLVDLPPDDVALVPPRSVLKTSSGKVRRTACRDLYERGRLGRVRALHPVLQVARATLRGIATRVGRGLQAIRRFLYTGLAWVLAWILLPIAWLGAVFLPPLSWRLAVARGVCRTFFVLMRIPLSASGVERVPRDRTFIVVSNHASYLDPMILLATLPVGFTFVVKREFEKNFFTRVLMRRLCTAFVERADAGKSLEDLALMRERVRHGTSIAVFPEGTFDPPPGMQAFRLGAFSVAVDAEVPIVPVAIRGSRTVLRDEQLWFVRRPLSVEVRGVLEPYGEGFREAVRLRNIARELILDRIDEPDLVVRDAEQAPPGVDVDPLPVAAPGKT